MPAGPALEVCKGIGASTAAASPSITSVGSPAIVAVVVPPSALVIVVPPPPLVAIVVPPALVARVLPALVAPVVQPFSFPLALIPPALAVPPPAIAIGSSTITSACGATSDRLSLLLPLALFADPAPLLLAPALLLLVLAAAFEPALLLRCALLLDEVVAHRVVEVD